MECLRWVHKRCSGIAGKLKSNVVFHLERCLVGENGLFQSVLLIEVVIEPSVQIVKKEVGVDQSHCICQ